MAEVTTDPVRLPPGPRIPKLLQGLIMLTARHQATVFFFWWLALRGLTPPGGGGLKGLFRMFIAKEFSGFPGFWGGVCRAHGRHRGSCAMPLAWVGHEI